MSTLEDLDKVEAISFSDMEELLQKDPKTARQKLYDLHLALCSSAFELMQKKNHDYAGPDDPFRNFRAFGPYGILVRLSDKLARLQSYLEQKELKVAEPIEETVKDAINYLVLFQGMLNETKK